MGLTFQGLFLQNVKAGSVNLRPRAYNALNNRGA